MGSPLSAQAKATSIIALASLFYPAETSGCRAAKSHGFGWSASPPSRASQQLRRQRHNDQAIPSDQPIKRSNNLKRLGRNQAAKLLSMIKPKQKAKKKSINKHIYILRATILKKP